jgi:hypothetical protein
VPHTVAAHFYRRTSVAKVALYLDYAADESYTPSLITVKAGSMATDAEVVAAVELSQPSGWVHISLGNKVALAAAAAAAANGDADATARLSVMDRVTRAHVVIISIEANHQGGRDTRVRHVRLVGPVDDAAMPPRIPAAAASGGAADRAIGGAGGDLAALLGGGGGGVGGGHDPWAFDGTLGLPSAALLSLR